MSEELPNFGRPQAQQPSTNSQPIDQLKQFSNPICEQTFIALPKIYGLRRGRRPKKRPDAQRLFRPCCQHQHCQQSSHKHNLSIDKSPRASIQQLLKKNIKPLPMTPAARLNLSKYSSLDRSDDRHLYSRQKSINSFSRKHPALFVDDSTTSIHGTHSQSDVNSVRHGRFKLDRLEARPKHLAQVDSEISHKVIRRVMPPIGAGMNAPSDSEVEISLKHIDAARSRLLQEDQALSRKTLQTQPSTSKKTLFEDSSTQKLHGDEGQRNKTFQDQSMQSEDSYEQREQHSFHSRKHQRVYAADQQEIEEEDENEEDNTIDVPQKKVKRKNAAVQMTEMKEAATQMENSRLNRTEISVSPDANTYFVELLKQQPFEKLRQSRCKSLKSSTTVEKYSVPSKSEIPSFIDSYKPMDVGFSLKELVKLPNFSIVPYRNAMYLGEFVEGQRHGSGVLIGQKALYEGQFQHGLKLKGIESTSEGVYKGSYVNGYREGHGQFRWFNQQVYIGEWKKGMKHGKGTWKSHNGSYYNGEWVENRQEGYGIHMHQGTVYRGTFKNFLKHGQGQQKFANGDHYQGEYSNGRCNGHGSYTWSNGMHYQGEFLQGMKHGKGILTDGQSIYQGCFQRDIKEGEGQITYRDGSKLRGQFHLGELTHGLLTHLNGERLEVGPFLQ